MNKKVLVIGSTVADVILNVDVLPKTAQDVHILSQRISLGGCAYNVSDVIRHLGVEYTLFSPVGSGVYGDFVRSELQKKGIAPFLLPQEENGCCYCMVEPGGERTFLSYHGAEYRFCREWFDRIDPNAYDAVYICGLEIEEPTGDVIIEFLEQMFAPEADCGKVLYFAPGPRILKISEERMHRLFALHPVMHLNKEEVCSYTGKDNLNEAAEALERKTGNAVVVTCGAQGAFLRSKQQETIVPAVPAEVKDTIGAGDSHAGAVIALKCRGYSWETALMGANRIAAAVTEVSGALLSEEKWNQFTDLWR